MVLGDVQVRLCMHHYPTLHYPASDYCIPIDYVRFALVMLQGEHGLPVRARLVLERHEETQAADLCEFAVVMPWSMYVAFTFVYTLASPRENMRSSFLFASETVKLSRPFSS